MPDTTPNLSLPYILPAQAQKHVTHNEALRVLDLVTQLSVASASMTVPPAEIIEGRRYVVPTGATGAWATHDGDVAILEQAAWSFLAPQAGWIAWVEDAAELRIFDGTDWVTPDVSIPTVLDELGIGTAPDATNVFAVSGASTLLTHDGAGHQLKVNKSGPAETASLLFQSNWSGRAEMGLVGDDSFQIKTSGDGVAFATAISADASGAVTLPKPIYLPVQSAPPTLPTASELAFYATSRAGAPYVEVMRPSGRNFLLQPSLGLNRVASYAPNSSSSVSTSGMPRTVVGTTSTPQIVAGPLSGSMRRWRVTSAASAGSASEERSVQWVCWRGNAAKLGGFTMMARYSLSSLSPDSTAFFGLAGLTSAFGGTKTLATMPACVGIGFSNGADTQWQIVSSDGTNPTAQIALGADLAISNLANVITLIIYAPPSGSSIWIEAVEEDTGTQVVHELTTDIPVATQLLSPRNYLNNGATAASVAYECSGVYIETDY